MCSSGATIRTGSVLFFGLGRPKPAPGEAAGGGLRGEAAVAAFLGGGRRSPLGRGDSAVPSPLAAGSGGLSAPARPDGALPKPLTVGGGPIRNDGGTAGALGGGSAAKSPRDEGCSAAVGGESAASSSSPAGSSASLSSSLLA